VMFCGVDPACGKISDGHLRATAQRKREAAACMQMQRLLYSHDSPTSVEFKSHMS
jgi:hypothetical protein